MFKSEKALILTESASSLSNNLSSFVLEHRSLIYYAVISRCSVNLISSAIDGHSVNQRTIICRDPKTSKYHLIHQAKLVLLKNIILVIAAEHCIQFYDVESTTLIGQCNINVSIDGECYSRGICVHDDKIICGTNSGSILIFESSLQKSGIQKTTSLDGHKSPIWDLNSHLGKLLSSDDFGNIMVWNTLDNTKKSFNIISGYGYPCTSMAGINETIVAAYGSGHIRLFDFLKGDIIWEIAAHAGWINSIDIASRASVIISVGEDSFIRLWKLTDHKVQNINNIHIFDERLMGVKFLSSTDDAFACTAYDTDKLFFYVRQR